MKKILVLVILIGVFYGCASREERAIENYRELYNNGSKTVRTLDGTVSVNLEDFFSLSKEEQLQKIRETEKDLEKHNKEFWGKRGIEYDENASDEEKSRQITMQTLELATRGMPPEIRERILNAKRKQYGIEKKDKSKDIISLIKDEDIDGVKKMLKNGFDVNKIVDTYYKSTIIYNAIYMKNLELVKIIVQHGAKLNIKTRTYDTPLLYACKSKNKHIVEYLINQNIDFSMQENLLQEIVVFNDFKLIDKCLAKGLDINSKNRLGNTPLLMAVYDRANLKTIKYLIKKGADINAISSDNKNILEVAKINNRKKIYNYLKKIYKPRKNSNLLNNEQSKILQKIHSQHNTLAIDKIDISKDEKLFVSSDYSGVIRVFNLENGKLIKKFAKDNKKIIFLKLIDNNKKLIVSSNTEIKIFDLNSGKILNRFNELSIDGDIEEDKRKEEFDKTYGKNNKNRHIYDAITNLFNDELGLVDYGIRSVDITPNNSNLVVLKTNGNINIWNIEKGKILKVIEDKKVISLAVIDNNRIIYSDNNNSIKVLYIDTEHTVNWVENGNAKTYDIYKRGSYIFVDNNSFYLRVLNIDEKKEVTGFLKPQEDKGFFNLRLIRDIAITDDKKVLIGTLNGRIYKGDILSTPKKRNKIPYHDINIIGYHNTGIKKLIILPKTKNLLSVDANEIKLWKL